jgi:Ca2+-binding EF-hand superfamily protein
MMAEWRFRALDVNGDGMLNHDELAADPALQSERDKWDTNQDGFIDLGEFKEYFRARLQAYQEAAAQGGPRPDAPLPEEKKATVYRAGKLPPNLPAWFAQYDTDGDGQVGLYEWMAAGQSAAEFEKMDRNGDGFLTVEEVLRATGGKRGETSTAVARADSPGASPRAAMTPGAGRWPGGGGRGFPGGGPGPGGGRRGSPGGGPGRGFPGAQ